MNLYQVQRQIDSLASSLKKAKESKMLSPDDPALVQMEQIMLEKIDQLQAAKTEEQNSAPFESLLFADCEDESEEQVAASVSSKRYARERLIRL